MHNKDPQSNRETPPTQQITASEHSVIQGILQIQINIGTLTMPLWALVGVLIVLLAVISFLFLTYKPDRRIEEHAFNVAIAGFVSDQNSDQPISSKDASRLANIFATELRERINVQNPALASLVGTIGVWSPSDLGLLIHGQTFDERTQSAEQLVRELKNKYNVHPHIVIYGVIHSSDEGVTLLPEFYVDTSGLRDISEVLGSYQFNPVYLARSPKGLDNASLNMIGVTESAEIFAFLIRGLYYYSSGFFEQAWVSFDSALALDKDAERSGAVLYVLRGNASAYLYNQAFSPEHFENARIDYCRAIIYDQTYARAFIGLANTDYILAVDDDLAVTVRQTGAASCSARDDIINADKNRATLDVAKATYELVSTLASPKSAYVSEKVAFGLGQVFLYQADSDKPRDWGLLAQAEEQFLKIINAHKSEQNSPVVELLVESHARLGLIYRWRYEWDKAKIEYQSSIALIDTEALNYLTNRRIAYQLNLSEIDIEIAVASGRYSEASQIYQRLLSDDQISDQDQFRYRLELGDLNYLAGNPEDAIQQYQEAERLAPDIQSRFLVRTRIGDIYYAIDMYDLAISAYQQALEVASSDSQRQQIDIAIKNTEAAIQQNNNPGTP